MHRDNNFDFLRFLFAVFVIVSHSYALLGIGEDREWLYSISNHQINFSSIGLSGFFVISGYFIFKSFERSKTIGSYLKKRFLRLFPGLFIVLLVSLLIVPFLYEGKTSLITNASYWTYLPYNLSLYGFQGVIPGVFDSNPYHAINGSLWTIRYEFSLYIFIALLFFIKTKKRFIAILTATILVLMVLIFNTAIEDFGGVKILGMQGYHILNLGGFFVAGTLLATLNFKEWNSPLVVVSCILLACIALYFNHYGFVKHVLFSIVILGIGFLPIKGIKDFGSMGDASYGIYIYAFPVQQVLVAYFDLSITTFIWISMMISVLLGYISWHLVEKRALKYKTKAFPWMPGLRGLHKNNRDLEQSA